MKDVVIFGLGDIAELTKFYFDTDSLLKVVAFSVDEQYLNSKSFCGLPVVDWKSLIEHFPPERYSLFVAVGYNDMNRLREIKYYEGKKMGYDYVNYVSSKASIFTDKIGENNFILEDNTIQPFVEIGNNNIIWSGNHIGHHSRIGNHNFISSQVTISGRVEIKDNCFLGINSSIKDHITIECFSLIGAGTWISKNTEEYGVYSIPSSKKQEAKSIDLKI